MTTSHSTQAPLTLTGQCRCGREVTQALTARQIGDAHVARVACARCGQSVYCRAGAAHTTLPEWVDPDAEVVF